MGSLAGEPASAGIVRPLADQRPWSSAERAGGGLDPHSLTLIGVVKTPEDWRLVVKKGQYRIPETHAPRRKFSHIAFYLPLGAADKPALFPKWRAENFRGWISHYARVLSKHKSLRIKLKPDEPSHPGARNAYFVYRLEKPRRLKRPVTNRRRMRVVFGIVPLARLISSRELKEVFDISPLEEIVEALLREMKLRYKREYPVTMPSGKRYRLDFALFPRGSRTGYFHGEKPGPVALECDGARQHNSPRQRLKDAAKDKNLTDAGWRILRLDEMEITGDLNSCRRKITEKAY